MLEVYKSFCENLLSEHPEYWPVRVGKNKYAQIMKEGKDSFGKPMPEEVINYRRFRKAVEEYFLKARDMICEGKVLVLGPRMGKIAAARVERGQVRMKYRIDWAKTMKNEIDPVTGRRKAVYKEVLDENYCRIMWEKSDSLKNSGLAQFKPCSSNMMDPSKIGFTNQFSANLVSNPNVQLVYRQHSIK